MQEPLIFYALPERGETDEGPDRVRVDPAVLRDVQRIARRTGASARYIASECIRYALRHVEIRTGGKRGIAFSSDEDN